MRLIVDRDVGTAEGAGFDIVDIPPVSQSIPNSNAGG